MTVGFHSPLPPARTGVADYASALLAALRRRGTVEVDSCDAGVCLYHLGNNPLHAGIYRRALARPGVIVLHDAVLQHFFLGSLDERSYVEEFVYNYGEWHRDLARELWAGRARSGSDHRYFEYPMLRRVAEASRAVIVHNPAAARMVLAHAPNARVHEVPHLFVPPPHIPAAEALRFRQELRIAPRTFLFAVLGYLRESKRLPIILRAFDEVRRQGVDAALVIAGEFVSSDLARAAAPLMDRPDILRLGRTAGARFLAARRRHGRLHQPAPSGGRGDVRHRHPSDGARQAGRRHRERGSLRVSPRRPACAWRPGLPKRLNSCTI